MIEVKRHVEEHVFATYYSDGTVVGRLFQTAHPRIPYEVFAYNESGGGERLASDKLETSS